MLLFVLMRCFGLEILIFVWVVGVWLWIFFCVRVWWWMCWCCCSMISLLGRCGKGLFLRVFRSWIFIFFCYISLILGRICMIVFLSRGYFYIWIEFCIEVVIRVIFVLWFIFFVLGLRFLIIVLCMVFFGWKWGWGEIIFCW